MTRLHVPLRMAKGEYEADPGCGERAPPRHRVGHDRVDVDELDHREAPEDLLPPAALVRLVEHVDQGALHTRDPNETARVWARHGAWDARAAFTGVEHRDDLD